ncbi:hypothetical protein HYC85_020797 [Camellia sinensis]|uniref:GH3 middle domain-containing protein n=1 Tax=Camellia sinensis TaxID=4442 RepID=A0A7J7GSK4_CAMSI|nr:hypothetical protein HYC85_020797 [Camellia sinensis]
MCHNIRRGRVSNWITDPGCRNAVSLVLGEPNSELACSIEAECRGKSWEGIIKKIWPRTKYIEVIVTGSMAQYIPTLEFYSGGGIPLVSTMYASSECYLGINLEPLCKPCDVSYTLLSIMAYFEFLPISLMEKNQRGVSTLPTDHELQYYSCSGAVSAELNFIEKEEDKRVESEAVGLVDVKLGHHYELVFTIFHGYRVRDILMVTGFHNNAPQFRFVQWRNVVLSIDTDKSNDEDLLNALIIEPLGYLLTEYTSYLTHLECLVIMYYFGSSLKREQTVMISKNLKMILIER